MILGVRVLLVALLLVGSTESVLCQALCAQPSDFQATADARSAETAMPDHAGCHGGGVASPEPLSDRSGESCQGGCCTVLARATADPISSPGPTPAASPMLAGVDLGEARIGPDPLSYSRPAAHLKSPFQFRNPPLLI
jgi:hypothetical protein